MNLPQEPKVVERALSHMIMRQRPPRRVRHEAVGHLDGHGQGSDTESSEEENPSTMVVPIGGNELTS